MNCHDPDLILSHFWVTFDDGYPSLERDGGSELSVYGAQVYRLAQQHLQSRLQFQGWLQCSEGGWVGRTMKDLLFLR